MDDLVFKFSFLWVDLTVNFLGIGEQDFFLDELFDVTHDFYLFLLLEVEVIFLDINGGNYLIN